MGHLFIGFNTASACKRLGSGLPSACERLGSIGLNKIQADMGMEGMVGGKLIMHTYNM